MVPPTIISNRSTRLISIYIVLMCIITITTHAFDDSSAPISWQCTQHSLLPLPTWCHRVPRGGSIIEEHVPNNKNMQSDDATKGSSNSSSQRTSSSSLLPLIDTKTASLALRLTCETNRRLYRGTIGSTADGRDSSSKRSDKTTTASTAVDDSTASQHHDMQSPYQQQQHQYPQQYYQQQQQQQQGGQMMVPSSIPPEIPSVTEEERAEERLKEETTIFHSIEPWKPPSSGSSSSASSPKEVGSSTSSRRGISRWGPDIDKYLDTLLCSIGLGTVDDDNDDATGKSSESPPSSTETTSSIVSTVTIPTINNSKNRSPIEDERQLILSLTLLYLDHSISLDTPRHLDPHTGRPWYPPCPQILPRTVHRLVLTAMIIATKTVRGSGSVGNDSSLSLSNLLREAANKLLGDDDETYTVSVLDLEQMEQWMLHSLGADASGTSGQWQISVEDVQDFMRKWSETFYPQRLVAHDERNRSRMEKLERFWREKTGAFGGGHYNHHGQYGGDHGHGHSWNGVAAPDQYQQYEQQY
mmetsp:Transcript_21718/g.32590  ORF Transcript_21718/g.32590 Transcript_21718/m.32590 type:complete len:527 (-) Transcript_21718:41-1621(-)